jgi:hypothetical protein
MALLAKAAWQSAWQTRPYRVKLLAGSFLLLLLLACLPPFFHVMENRNGSLLPDILLSRIDPRDVSLPIFLLVWASCLLLIFRIFKDPGLLLLMLWSYDLLTLMRMTCIAFVSLNPPPGLIVLADPLSNAFYGGHYITHDLFFSGHTATVCLMFYCLRQKQDRYFTGMATILIGLLLLVQHIHYTIDVLAAPVFAWLVYRIALAFTLPEREGLTSD